MRRWSWSGTTDKKAKKHRGEAKKKKKKGGGGEKHTHTHTRGLEGKKGALLAWTEIKRGEKTACCSIAAVLFFFSLSPRGCKVREYLSFIIIISLSFFFFLCVVHISSLVF